MRRWCRPEAGGMSTRRALLTATAGVLTIGTDGVPSLAPHPDAALLALCAQLEGMQQQWQRLYDATSDADELTTPADHAWQVYSEDVWPCTALQPKGSTTQDVPALLLTHAATTLKGLQAKAAAILAINAAADFCDLRDNSLDLALSLIRDAATLHATPFAPGRHSGLTPFAPGGSRLADGPAGASDTYRA